MSVAASSQLAAWSKDPAVYDRAKRLASESPLGISAMMSRHGFLYWMEKAAVDLVLEPCNNRLSIGAVATGLQPAHQRPAS